ncbi:MAG: energy transducer TonB [Pyrinomonadaceae bacterium]
MKAITCSQCGAVIKRIRIRDKYAHCDYCDAVFPIEEKKVIEIPSPPGEDQTQQLSNWEIYLRNREEVKKKYPEPVIPVETEVDDLALFKIVAFLSIIAAVVFGAIILKKGFSDSKIENKPAQTHKRTVYENPGPTPCPGITVWSVPLYFENDTHYIEKPKLDLSKLPTCDKRELKTTIFSDQNDQVEVRVTVDKNGNVTEAKAVSGDEFLRGPAEEAARKSLFTKRPKPQKRTIKYYFIL